MPTPRKYATNAARQAAYRARCGVTAASPAAPVPVSPGPRRWAALLQQACGLLEEIVTEMTTVAEARSEAWQESERGGTFLEQIGLLEEAVSLLQDLPEA